MPASLDSPEYIDRLRVQTGQGVGAGESGATDRAGSVDM